MKQSEIKELSTAELQEKIGELRMSYSNLKMTHAITPLENPIELRNMRRTVARLCTELTNR